MGYCGMASGEISIRYREFHHMVRNKHKLRSFESEMRISGQIRLNRVKIGSSH